MELTLCMIVKDEEDNIADCLRPIHDLVSDIQIIDTGSSDRTVEILQGEFNIHPRTILLRDRHCFSFGGARTLCFQQAKTDWIMLLDADERIERGELEQLIEYPMPQKTHGLFVRWVTQTKSHTIEDYKLPIFSKDTRHRGRMHDTAQPDFRKKGRIAKWYNDLTISHFPKESSRADKSNWRLKVMSCGLRYSPKWYRHSWFLGYTYYKDNDLDNALQHLQRCANSNSERFPVERINSLMVMTEIYAQQNDMMLASASLNKALQLYLSHENDFEVSINFRMKHWLYLTSQYLTHGELHHIKAYEFSY